MNFSIPLLLHGDLKAAVQDLVERVDPVLHLSLAVRGQQVGALILHLQLEREPPNLVVLQPRPGRRSDERQKKESTGKLVHYIHIKDKKQFSAEQRLSVCVSDIE